MASAATAHAPAIAAYGNAAFGKVEIDLKKPTTVSPKFDPVKHMSFEQPKASHTLKELLLSPENAISPIAITEPFRLFTIEGVREMRADLFRREMIERHAWKERPGVYKIRGYGKDAPFVYDTWKSEAIRKACSEAAGCELEVVFDYEIGHTNVQLDSVSAKNESIVDVLPHAMPPKQEVVSDYAGESASAVSGQLDDTITAWHNDSYPWVCVCMLSDPTGMKGGETALRRGDGSIFKVRGPDVGYAVMMQGGVINHVALRALGTGERVTMVTSFRPKDPLARDGSNLKTVKKVSHLDTLFTQWTTYRMDNVAKRAASLKATLEKGNLSAEDIKKILSAWVKEQVQYLEATVSEMS